MFFNQKFFKKIIAELLIPKNMAVIIYILTTLLLSFILISRYYLFKNIIENGVSTKDIYATRNVQVIDREKTIKRKNEVAQEIDPIMRPISDTIDKQISVSLGELLCSIKKVRDQKINFVQKKDKIKSLLDASPEENYFTNNSLVYLSKATDYNFGRISNESLSVLNKVLKRGVSEAELIDNGDKIISEYQNKSMSLTQQRAVALIVKKILQPNMIIDEMSTDLTRRNAMNSVTPVVIIYKKGDKVVSAGEIVLKTQKDALKKLGYNITQIDLAAIVGMLVFVGLCLYALGFYIVKFESRFIAPSYLSLISLLLFSLVICAVFLPYDIPVYIIPLPAVAILLTIFTNARISLMTTILAIIMIGVALQYKIEAMAVFMIGGIVSTYSASLIKYYRRMDLLKSGFDVGLIQIVAIFSIYLMQNSFDSTSPGIMFAELALSFMNGLFSGIIALGTIPFIENAFKIVTPYGLAELADHNQALLKRLQFEAPGTYHHSLMVSNLAVAAAEAIGANPVLASVGAFYHDIGKLKRPLFFVENQSYFGIENPHEKLNPRLSKMIVTAHPKDGIELAKEYKLPNIVNQFIIQHHGDGVAAYFYKQALEAEGVENVTKEQFRYSNPKPSTKEAGILMIADAVESAVRSLKNPSQTEIEEMIDKLIKERLMDGQLSETPLTQKDIKVIAMTFNRILRGMQHHRIKYHQDVLEELGQKTNVNVQLAQTLKKIENEFPKGQ